MKKFKIPYLLLRRISQILFVVLFLFLFRKTDYAGTDTIPYAVNIFFQLNPLIAVSVMLMAKTIVNLVLPAFFILALTLILGRVFCGWFCPLGSFLDFFGKIISPKNKNKVDIENKPNFGYLKYVILIIILISSFFGLQLVGFFDPFALLVRGLTFSVDTVFNSVVTSFFDFFYKSAPPVVTAVSEPVYSFIKATLLPYKQAFFALPLLSFLILLSIFALEVFDNRFWCKNLCPLGGLLGLFSRYSLLKRFPQKKCGKCKECTDRCKMNAFNTSGYVLNEECTLCMECNDFCPKDTASFKFIFNNKDSSKAPVNLSRRLFIGAGLTGIALPFVSRINANNKINNSFLIRPPGALEEEQFVNMCVRCGECMKVCITNGLQPVFLEAGVDAMYTPKLIPQIGHCEYNCNLCGQVCPTGAIKKLSLEEKRKFVLGRAYIDTTYCIAYQAMSCLVCEEHCPVPDKAIKYREMTINPNGKEIVLRRPYIEPELCIGCGLCENKCPVTEHKAIRVLTKNIRRV